MFSKIFKFFGGSKKENKETKISPKALTSEEILKSVADFRNRPIHKTITVDIIDQTADDKLLPTVFDNLCEKLPKDYSKVTETVLNFSKARQAIYLIWLLEAEVNNGGYNQFYFNSSSQFVELVPDALKLVGAKQFLDLTIKANNIFRSQNGNSKGNKDISLEEFSKSYEDNPLNDLDTKFYDLYKIEDLQKLQIDFIRRNKIEFADN